MLILQLHLLMRDFLIWAFEEERPRVSSTLTAASMATTIRCRLRCTHYRLYRLVAAELARRRTRRRASQ